MQLPDNIKQIGALEHNLRIYMEDYVYTYICQYAKASGSKEKLGVLLGKNITENNQNTIIISGFIQGKNTENIRGSEAFTEDSKKYITEAKNTYFKDLDVVGWVHTQPGFGGFLMSKDEAFHKEFFPDPDQVLYVLDPTEKIDTFYIKNAETNHLSAAKGYFIYYDSNDAMQDYMIDNRLAKAKIARFPEEEDSPKKAGILSPFKKEPDKVIQSDPASVGRNRLKKRSKNENDKRKLAILGTVSALLCASCLMICLNVMNHSERIRNIEAELNSTASLSPEPTATVFASQSETETPPATETEIPPFPASTEEPVIPESEPIAEPVSDIPDYYIVEKGDSLSYISRKFYGDDSKIDEIMALNGITNSNKIYYGKKISLPTS